MRNFVVSMLLCVPVLVACGTTEPAFGQPGASVVREAYAPAGVYTFNFNRDKVYDSQFVRADAVKNYLGRHPELLPPSCSSGLEILGVVDGDNGDSAAKFKCLVPNARSKELGIRYF